MCSQPVTVCMLCWCLDFCVWVELKLLNRLCVNNKFQEMYHCRVTSALQLLVCDVFWNFADGSFVKLRIFCIIVICYYNHNIILKLINA